MGYYLLGICFWIVILFIEYLADIHLLNGDLFFGICFLDYCLDIKKKNITRKGGLDYLYIISQRFIFASHIVYCHCGLNNIIHLDSYFCFVIVSFIISHYIFISYIITELSSITYDLFFITSN